ncbi:hypothetical protein QTG54_011514 [Skeletonema marinoi]|uniref:Uncharacterized protein n=1 Tax=Skeletonema marinoi TaxID=267567 RepID=A0AAD9D8A6_9STRA|nr:hypothetical protein QTG54_011514 [Skeletonema marinoi]
MKVQIIASTALMLLSAIPGALSAEHLHPKEAVAATAADFEDDFEEKSPSAKSFSLRGAVAAAAAEDAADEDEELIQWHQWAKRDWSKDPTTGRAWGAEYRHRDWSKNPETGRAWGAEYRHHDWSKNPTTGKRWGAEHRDNVWGNNPHTGQPWGSVANDWCYGLNKDGCPITSGPTWRAECRWRNNECVPRN